MAKKIAVDVSVKKPQKKVEVETQHKFREVPAGGSLGQVVTRTITGYNWQDPPSPNWDLETGFGAILNKPFNKIDGDTLSVVDGGILKVSDTITGDITEVKTQVIDLSNRVTTIEEAIEWKDY